MFARAHPRLPMVRPIRVFELNDRNEPVGPAEAQSIDISRGGFSFATRRLYHAGRTLIIEIQKAGERIPTFLYGTVRHSRYVSGRGHVVGMQLAPLPESPEFMEWVAGRLSAASHRH